MYEFTIIGAGLTGSFIARELRRYNASVCILEKCADVAMGTSCANSGIVHAGYDAKENTLKAMLNIKGSLIMEETAKQLGVSYKNNGALVLGYNQEDSEVINTLYQRGIKNGVKKLEVIKKEKVKEIEPNISDNVLCALYAPTSGIISPYELNIAACGNAIDNGAELKLNFEVNQITFNEDFFVISDKKEELHTKYIINAAGLYADNIAQLIGDTSFKIKPRKGEYILFSKESGNILKHTIFRTPSKTGKGILITPTTEGNILLGPTSEDVSDKEDTSTTQKGIDTIHSQVLQDCPSINIRDIITSFAGLRAHSDNDDFIIQPSAINHHFINVAGIKSPGLTAAPAIGAYIVDLLQKQGYKFKANNNFNPVRKPFNLYRDLSTEQKNKVIRKDKAYGKIVCRCEGISEGEIIEAIKINPKAVTVDGVKRRTRCGMGLCQGGFCSERIIDILSKQMQISYENITKKGGNSYINVRRTK